jgi:hypothetical protein
MEESPPPLELDIQKLRIVKRARRLFECLSQAGTARDKAGNRHLLYSHYASLVLLSMFNPAIQSLRGMAQASQLKKVQKQLGTSRVSLGSLSESCRVFDPQLLVPLIEQLLADLPAHHPGPGPRRHIPPTIPQELAEKLRVADGSTLRVLPQLIQNVAAGSWKLHLQFRLLQGIPDVVTLTPEYTSDERDVLASNLQPGCVYIADRGYERYALWNQIVAAGSDYVIRGQAQRPATVVETRPLSEAAQAARIVSDEIVKLGSSRGKPDPGVARIDHPVRRIIIQKRAQGRQRSDRSNSDKVILLTNLVDLPAEVIAALYELRWCIELFFRFLKQLLGCKRLFSTKEEGITIQVYCALIACLLLAHATGGPVRMQEYRLICLYLQGWADEEELLAGLKLKAKEP